jgi:hypothetical protein
LRTASTAALATRAEPLPNVRPISRRTEAAACQDYIPRFAAEKSQRNITYVNETGAGQRIGQMSCGSFAVTYRAADHGAAGADHPAERLREGTTHQSESITVPEKAVSYSLMGYRYLDRERILKMARLSTFTKTNLNEQGFGKLNDEMKSHYALPLRFTPGVGTTLVVVGLALQSPMWLGSMALVALSGALFPRGMLIDLVYNLAVRHIFRLPPLPPTPKPRQFSYLISTVFLAASAVSFSYGRSVVGFILGGMVVIGGTILTTTLWCLGSWFYRLIFGHDDA